MPDYQESNTIGVYLEVSRINSQLEGMQLAQGEQSTEKIIDFFNSQAKSSNNFLSMVSHWSRAGRQVAPVGEVGLGLRVDQEQSAK